MARGINKVILIGNLGAEPEIRYLPSGAAVANVSVATTDSRKDRQTGEQKEQTEWHRVVFFSRLAEIVGEYLHKGSKIYIEGRLQTRKWQDKNGTDRYTTEIIANEMQMLDSRGASAPMGNEAPMMGSATPPAGGDTGGSNFSKSQADFDDDIPF